MKGRTSLKGFSRYRSYEWMLAVLLLLSVAGICSGQQGRNRRTGRARAMRGAPRKIIQLPAPATASATSIEQVLARQQNLETPTDLRLTFAEIGQLLWAGQGVMVQRSGTGTVPDALIPMKVYVVLPDGVYAYSPSNHALQQSDEGDVRASLATAILNRQGVPVGGCQILIAGSAANFSTRLGTRAKAAMLLLAGQMAQSIQLQAVSLDLTYLAVNNVDTMTVRRLCRLDRTLMPLYIAMVGYPASRAMSPAPTRTLPAETTPEETTSPAVAKALIIAPQREFQDEELVQTKFALEAESVDVQIASNRSGRILGTGGTIGEAGLALADVNVVDYDALIFIGGAGAVPLASNTRVQELVRQAVAEKKLLAASGTGALILANTNVIKSARVTGLAAHAQLFVLAGAVYTGAPVEKDGTLITSTGPLVVPLFARTILEALTTQ